MFSWTQSTCERPSGEANAVVWDFGNVLLRWDPPVAVANRWNRAEFTALAARADFERLNNRMDAGLPIADILETLQGRDPEAAELWNAYFDNAAGSLIPDIVGTPELLVELADAGIPQFGLTNWSAAMAPRIPHVVPGARLLQSYLVSGIEGVAKPNPAFYQLLIERTGLDPQTTLFIDDRSENTAAAAELGFMTHTFNTPTGADQLRDHMALLGLPVSATFARR